MDDELVISSRFCGSGPDRVFSLTCQRQRRVFFTDVIFQLISTMASQFFDAFLGLLLLGKSQPSGEVDFMLEPDSSEIRHFLLCFPHPLFDGRVFVVDLLDSFLADSHCCEPQSPIREEQGAAKFSGATLLFSLSEFLVFVFGRLGFRGCQVPRS